MSHINLVFLPQFFIVIIFGVSLGIQHCHNITGRCYWMGNESVDRVKAVNECSPGLLAVMETEQLWNFVIGAFSPLPSNTYIGMEDSEKKGDFRWMNNVPLYYERWQAWRPDRDKNKYVVVVNSAGQWVDTNGYEELPFLCSSSVPECTEPKDGCSHKSLAFMGKLHGPYGPSNWFEAKATCEGQDRKLLTIDSQEEEDKFRQIVEPSVVYWLGMSDLEVHSVYRTVDGILPKWTNWASTEPSYRYGYDENCVQRYESNADDGKWNDGPCRWEILFFCETKRPVALVNDQQTEVTELLDNDTETCVEFSQLSACSMKKISLQFEWSNGTTLDIKFMVKGLHCTEDYWTLSWKPIRDKFTKCKYLATDNVDPDVRSCVYRCDGVTGTAREVQLIPHIPLGAICEITV